MPMHVDEPTYARQLSAAVETALATAATPGAAVAVLCNGQPAFISTSGFRDLERTLPLADDAQWYIYSITKTLIATLVLQMDEQGRVRLDAPVQTYLPRLPLKIHLTLRQLLNHTSGLPDYGSIPAYAAAIQRDPGQPWDTATFLRTTLEHGLLFTPGQGWAYSNLGYMLLRQLIETLYGSSLQQIVADRLVAPLGLHQLRVIETLSDARQLTPGYSTLLSSDSMLADVHELYPPGWVAHGVVGASAGELAHLIDAIFTQRFFGPASRAAMWEAVPVRVQHPLFREPAYGLGVMIDQASRAGFMVGHGGGGPGYSAGVLHLPAVNGRRITSVALANRDQPDLGLRIAFELAMLTSAAILSSGPV